MLGCNDQLIIDLFKENNLIEPTYEIPTKALFLHEIGSLIINGCGEATIMLNTLLNETNDVDDCNKLLKMLWKSLFIHINLAKNVEHINLIFYNLNQMQKIVKTVSF